MNTRFVFEELLNITINTLEGRRKKIVVWLKKTGHDEKWRNLFLAKK
jgi:hypothetical protein